MKETNEHLGMLLLFDAIGLLLTTVVLAMVLSKLTGSIDINALILSIFFFGLKVLLMGICDITGIGKKIWVAILFVLFADFLIFAVNILMAFGISNKVILITAAADILIILLIRIIWKAVFRAKGSAGEPVQEEMSKSDLYENQSEKRNEKSAPAQLIEKPDYPDRESVMGVDALKSSYGMIEDPVVQVGTESLTPISGEKTEITDFSDQPGSSSGGIMLNKNENKSIDDLLGFDVQKAERPSDAPNLDALNAFFGESDNHPEEVEEKTQNVFPSEMNTQDGKQENIRDTVVLSDVIEEVEALFENGLEKETTALPKEDEVETGVPSQEIDDLTQEMNRQFEVLQNRVDNLEQREADLKRREEAFKQSQSSAVTVKPQEVHIDNSESEIIINEDDLALLKAYLKQHPEI